MRVKRPWRLMTAATILAATGGWALAGTALVHAHGVCTTIAVVSKQQRAVGFTPTILDGLAFPLGPLTPMATPLVSPVVVVKQVVVCPQVVFVTPAFSVFSTVVDPPPPAWPPSPNISSQPTPPALSGGIPGAAPHDTVRDLAQSPEIYDRQVLSVTGIVGRYAEGRDQRGVPYTTFELKEGAASVWVVSWGQPTLRQGMAVRVTGPFYAAPPFALASGTSPPPTLEAQLIIADSR